MTARTFSIGLLAAMAACVAQAAVFNVRDYGAKGDGTSKDTDAVQKAVDAASAAGGGEVLLPKGTYLCGSVFLKSGVDFHIAEDATLKGSPDPADYNALDVAPQNWGRLGSGDNISGGHLILCIEQKNVTLRGPGKVDGNVKAFLKMPDGSHPANKLKIPWRPAQMVWFVESRDITIRDIELADAPYWSCFVYGCEDVTVDNAYIHTVRHPHTYNGDGLDIDSSRRVRVTGCRIFTADDSITIRAAGQNRLKNDGPCADVTVSNCTFSSDCNAIRLGVGNGRIRDCSFADICIENTRYAVNAVGAWSRPEPGVDISNVSFRDMTIDAKAFCKFYYKHATKSVFDGITFRHVRGKVREPSIFDDTPARPFRNLKFEDVLIAGETSPRVVLSADAAMPKDVLYTRGGVTDAAGLFAKGGKVCRLAWDGAGEKPVLALDFGGPSVGGYAVFSVKEAKGRPTLRLAYANHPDGLGEKGCFSRETSARYLGPDFDIPVLPGNINRHEIYSIGRTGLYVAPLIQGQERYVRVQLDTPGEVAIEALAIVNAEVFSSEPRCGSFRCSDDRLTRLWDISVWTCQLASFPNHDAWRIVAGRLLPRKLEQGEADCWRRQPAAADGTLRIDYEFDANPHFPVGRFEILVGESRISVAQDATNEVRHLEVPVKKGDRIGLSVPKESWPVVWSMTLGGQNIMDLAGWDYARTLPYIADGAKRDRLIWSGDLWWAERNMFYAFGGESPYMKGSVKMLAFNRTPEGYVHASPYAERSVRPPTGDYGPFGSDEFAAWFVPVTWDYYLYTADRETLRDVWPDVAALMRYLNAHRRGDGIFEQRKETCKHAAGLQFGGTSLHHRSYMNILLWKTLEDAASIAAALRHDHEAAVWRADARRFADIVRKTFWDEAGGFFRLSAEDGRIGFEANALALATRFATQQEAVRIMPQLKYNGHGKFQALAARGKYEYGDAVGALKALEDHNWYKLLDPSWKSSLTVSECMGLHHRGWGDESHPDTAIAGIYSSYVLGIVPLTPGFQRFSFRPQTDGLTFAEGTVPTYFGDIRARWEKKGEGLSVTITVPPGTTGEFVWRDQKRILPPGTHVIK